MSEPTSHRSESGTDTSRETTSWNASRPPHGPEGGRGADRLTPYQADAPHRQAARLHTAADSASGHSRTTTTDDGAERVVPPSAPLAVSPRTVRHTAPPRRRRWWRAAATTGTLVMLPFLPVSDHPREGDRSAAESSEDGTGRDAAFDAGLASLEASRVAYRDADAREEADQTQQREEVASYEDLTLAAISSETQVIGFHEAYHGGGLSLTPEGPVQANHNPGKSDVRPDADAEVEPVSMILPTRERPTDAHSAVDIAIPEGAPISSPVDGTIVSVSEYQLYGQYPDLRIEIRPDDRPDILVVVLHVTDAQVEVGDEVAAGATVIAGGPTAFPFASQIDRFAEAVGGRALPHVHIELQRIA